jgi:hypothetical protein
MFVAFMSPCICFCTDLLLYIYSVSRKCPLSFKSILDPSSKPKQRRSISKILTFHFFENIIGFKIQFKFYFDTKPYFEKKL